MNREDTVTNIGRGFGVDAADHIERRAQDYCTAERERIALVNEARITALRMEGNWLAQRERELTERLRLAPQTGDTAGRRRSVLFHWVTGIVLALAAFVFSLIAFDPFRLGPKAYFYCAGIAVVVPFLTERFLDVWKSERLLKGIITGVFLAAITGGALLAVVRGELFSRQIADTTPAAIIDGETPSQSAPQNDFYQTTGGLLRILMVLLTVAIDVGSGIAIHRALEVASASGEDLAELERESAGVRERLAEIVFELTMLGNGAAIFEKEFWTGYYWAMLTQTARRAVTRALSLILCLVLLGGGRAFAQERVNLVVALDLSASEAVTDRDGKTEFHKNVDAVGRLLATVPSSAKVTVIAITEHSFADHYILLPAVTSGDAGYFRERLASARRQLVEAWRKRSTQLQPSAPQTDILGALCVASELLYDGSAATRVLVVYSDMRNATQDLNLETRTIPDTNTVLRDLENRRLLADLQGVSVYVAGADASGQNLAQWDSVRAFWRAYFGKAGASVIEYSGLREAVRPLF